MQSGAVLTMDNSREHTKLVVGDLIGVNVDGMVISPGWERMADGRLTGASHRNYGT